MFFCSELGILPILPICRWRLKTSQTPHSCGLHACDLSCKRAFIFNCGSRWCSTSAYAVSNGLSLGIRVANSTGFIKLNLIMNCSQAYWLWLQSTQRRQCVWFARDVSALEIASNVSLIGKWDDGDNDPFCSYVIGTWHTPDFQQLVAALFQIDICVDCNTLNATPLRPILWAV